MKVIYPGTFDPFTNGHLDIVTRASKIFKNVILGIFSNSKKDTLFNLYERTNIAKKSTKHLCNVNVISFDSLLVDFAKIHNTNLIIRGVRNTYDFEYEIQLLFFNKKLNKKLENIFLIPSEPFTHISSSLVKEIAFYRGNIKNFLPKASYLALIKKINKYKII